MHKQFLKYGATYRSRQDLRAIQAARQARLDAAKADAHRIVATGFCPECGRRLRRNLALAGWWQCSQFGAVNFRADASQPSCDFQAFTE